jgi:putative membrane protein
MKRHSRFWAAVITATGLALWSQTPPAQTTPREPQSTKRPETSRAEGQTKAEGKTAPDQKKAGTARSDERFIREAYQGNLAEIELAQLAQQRASSQAVKDYAKSLEQDHRTANERLQTIAQQHNISLTDQPPKTAQKMKERLSKLSGEQFDREFVRHALKEHREDVAKYKKHTQQTQNADVREYASNTLPTLQQHLEMAERTASQIGVATAPRERQREAGDATQPGRDREKKRQEPDTTKPQPDTTKPQP